jgi:cation transport ATPase
MHNYQSGASIEQIGKAQAVVFDKTGTITLGTPVEEIMPLDSGSQSRSTNNADTDDTLFKAASVERLSSHTVAQAPCSTRCHML